MAIKITPSIRVHPGSWLKRNFVEPYGLTIQETAAHLGIARPNMSRLLNGKAALTPDMARRFEKAFGVSASTMLRMQSSYDLAQLELVDDPVEVERIPEPA